MKTNRIQFADKPCARAEPEKILKIDFSSHLVSAAAAFTEMSLDLSAHFGIKSQLTIEKTLTTCPLHSTLLGSVSC